MFFPLERVNKIAQELKSYIYQSRVKVENFKMKEGNYKSPQDVDASSAPWKEFISGTRWGGYDSHAWFRTDVTIPEEMDGKTVAIIVNSGQDGWDATNPQFIAYVNGVLMQGLDRNHQEVVLAHSAKAGNRYQIDLHAYSGMGHSKVDLFVNLVVVDTKIRKLYYDIYVPLQVAQKLPKDDKKRIDILTALNNTVNLLDLRKPLSPMFYDSVEKAEEYIEEEFYKKICGPQEAEATCVGHTHIDVAWLWTLAQTREKTARSFSTVLRLMEEYPEYIFMSSQPQLYKFLKEDYPDVYNQVKDRVKEGRWEADGAMWLEADCNLTSGESLVRQILFGTRFFEKEFGVKNHVLWLPDVFGYSAALPQILKKSDIDYFMTTKISWNQFNKLPYDTFMWKGLDGTEVLTHFVTTRDYEPVPTSHGTTYNGNLVPSQVMGAWQRYQQKDINNDVLISYGYGDGGGGPTRDMLENGRRMSRGIPGCPKVKMGTANDYFKKLEQTVKDSKYLPKWVGELYLEYHRGTYTSMGRNKRYNRKSEFLYQDTEFLSSLAMLLGHEYPQQAINQGWETILLNQFHDIIPGSSIREVYEDSKEQYEEILNIGTEMANKATEGIGAQIDLRERSVVVYNTLSFNRDDIVTFEVPVDVQHPCIVDDKGQVLPCQLIEKNGKREAIFFAQNLPSKGYKAYTLRDRKVEWDTSMEVSSTHLENKYFSMELDDKGTFTSIYDKINMREVLKEGQRGNQIQAFEDKPMNWDNWDIDVYYQEKMWEVDEVEKVEVIENGPVRSGVRVYKKFMDSTIIQNIYIYQDIPRIDFDSYVDWKEDQVLLKAAFPVDVHADKATYDIQFGNVERPTHWNTSWDLARFEVCAHKWADLSEEGFGVSLLNDCKYGHDIKDGVMRITLLKSGMHPNNKADREEHRFVYSLYPHAGDWKDGNTVKMGYQLNVPVYAKVEQAHEGTLPPVLSVISVDCDNVIVETIKKAEDSDDLIIRLYECYNKRTDVTLTFFKPLLRVVECNLMEKDIQPVDVQENTFSFQIKPYEIKTFKLIVK
jgi:alpha-mannosidase